MFREKRTGLRDWSRKSALFGAVAWLITAAASLAEVPGFWLTETLFLLGPLVVVPLGLALIADGAVRPATPLRLAATIQPFAAVAVAISFLFRPGVLPATLVLPWLGVTALLGVSGLLRLRQSLSRIEELCFSAALLYLPVGGIWLVLTRLGETPMGLSDAIVLLTAVHFHFAGFGACCMAGAVGRAAGADGPRQYSRYRLAGLGVIVGTFFVAIGFLVSPWPKFLAIALFATSLMAIATLQFSLAPQIPIPPARTLLRFSALSLVVGIALAVIYGLGEARIEEWISIPGMARTHGVINALGFTLCGLVGWTLASAKQPIGQPSPKPHRPSSAPHITAEVGHAR